LAWIAQRLVSSKRPTRYASDASWSARIGGGLEAEVRLEVLGDLADEALEGELADEELGGLLVLADLTERDGTGPVAVRLLDAAGRRGGLARRLGGELLAGRLATGGLARGLLRTGHCGECVEL
jgi:hypothetical protein